MFFENHSYYMIIVFFMFFKRVFENIENLCFLKTVLII